MEFNPSTNAEIILKRLKEWKQENPDYAVDDELNQIQAELHTVTRSDPEAVTPYYLAVLQALIDWGKEKGAEALFTAATEFNQSEH